MEFTERALVSAFSLCFHRAHCCGLQVQHPAAKMLVMAMEMQDQEVSLSPRRPLAAISPGFFLCCLSVLRWETGRTLCLYFRAPCWNKQRTYYAWDSPPVRLSKDTKWRATKCWRYFPVSALSTVAFLRQNDQSLKEGSEKTSFQVGIDLY